MRLSHSLVAVVGLSTAVLVGCSGRDKTPSTTVTMSPPVGVRPPAPGDPSPGEPSCPRTGKWQPCGLVDRIVHAGLSFRATGDSVRVPFFAVPGVRYRVAVTDTMLAFFFPDSMSLAKAVKPLDSLRMTPPGDSVSPWPSVPNVIRSGNLLALYFATSERQIERLRLAITAGAPSSAR